MKTGLLFLLAAAPVFGYPGPFPLPFKAKDAAFFFTSVRTQGSDWVYQLSPHTLGMRWQIKGEKTDASGICMGGTELKVSQPESLELTNGGIDLRIFRAYGLGPDFREANLQVAPQEASLPPGKRVALVSVTPDHQLDSTPIPSP